MSGTSSKLEIPPSDPTTIVDLDLQEVLLQADPAKTKPAVSERTDVASTPPPDKNRSSKKARSSDDLEKQDVSDERIERQLERRRARQKRWLGQPIPYRPEHLPKIVVAREKTESPRSQLGDLVWRACATWVGSALLHVLALLALSCFTLSQVERDKNLVLLGDAEPRKIEPLIVDVEISVPTIVPERSATNRVTGEFRPDRRSGSMPAVLPQFLSSSKKRAGPVGSVRRLFGREGNGGSDVGSGKGGAEFFGVKATGRKFVFVVDSSRSMTGPKWFAACHELYAAISRLRPNQQFYVVFFDGRAHPMPRGFEEFNPPGLLAATEDNRLILKQFVSSIQLGFDTRPYMAMRMAMELKPDAIYLLSDGEFKDNTARYLKRNNKIRLKDRLKMPAVVVHTIGFHSRAGQRILRRIAKDNGGTYKFVSGRK